MFEGKELEGKIGNEGGYSVDITSDGYIKVDLNYTKNVGDMLTSTTTETISLDMVVVLKALEAKLGNEIATKVLDLVIAAFPRK